MSATERARYNNRAEDGRERDGRITQGWWGTWKVISIKNWGQYKISWDQYIINIDANVTRGFRVEGQHMN